MTKHRLITTFVLAILLLGSLVGIAVNSQPTLAANFNPVPAASYVDTLGYAAQMTASVVQETTADAESESETHESATEPEQVQKKAVVQDDPPQGLPADVQATYW